MQLLHTSGEATQVTARSEFVFLLQMGLEGPIILNYFKIHRKSLLKSQKNIYSCTGDLESCLSWLSSAWVAAAITIFPFFFHAQAVVCTPTITWTNHVSLAEGWDRHPRLFHSYSISLFYDVYWEEIKNIFNMKSFKNDNPQATICLWKLEMKISFCEGAGRAALPRRPLARAGIFRIYLGFCSNSVQNILHSTSVLTIFTIPYPYLPISYLPCLEDISSLPNTTV